jgi:methyl-accepting chemotaxis protein
MTNLTLRTKLIAGFAIMIALICSVSILSIVRFSDIASLGGAALEENSRQAFALSKEIDHLNWINDVSDLFLLEDVQHLEVETDWTKCGLGEWIYGNDMEAMMAADAELDGLVGAIKPPHEDMHQTAVSIDEIYVEFDKGLITMLDNVWIDHLEWIKDLNYSIMNGTGFTGQTDPRKCNFGKWYYSYTPEDPEFAQLLRQWEDPHTRLHESAAAIISAVEAGNNAQALTLYNTASLAELDTLREAKGETLAYLNGLAADQGTAVAIFQSKTLPALAETQAALGDLVGFFERRAEEARTEMNARVSQIILTVILIAIAALVIGLILAIITTGSILTQLGSDPAVLAGIARKVAAGDLTIDLNGRARMQGVYGSVVEMVSALKEKADSLELIASGDFTGDIHKAGDNDALGNSMLTMQESLTSVLTQVRQAVEQVAQGSDQVSQASQSLSQGATEQASSLEEISSSITEINGQATQNAESAGEANRLAIEARDNAVSGNRSMDELIKAMEQINEGSGEIKKVVKVIDDIAFQINLLALNANVEAARAGKYGRGFAVVAEEVRNLAARSAEAVRETTAIVDQSVTSTEQGDKLVKDTAAQLELIVNGAGKVASFLDEIATASREQAQGLSQISEGVEQIDEVTQANTASAEESASAAEELAGQGEELRRLIARFKLAAERKMIAGAGVSS